MKYTKNESYSISILYIAITVIYSVEERTTLLY